MCVKAADMLIGYPNLHAMMICIFTRELTLYSTFNSIRSRMSEDAVSLNKITKFTIRFLKSYIYIKKRCPLIKLKLIFLTMPTPHLSFNFANLDF